MRRERGTTRAIYLPKSLDEKVEETVTSLKWTRSRFYNYAVTKFLQELSVLSSTVHEEETKKE